MLTRNEVRPFADREIALLRAFAAWFKVQLQAPAAPGYYRLYVPPVIDGLEWLENVGAYVDVSVR